MAAAASWLARCSVHPGGVVFARRDLAPGSRARSALSRQWAIFGHAVVMVALSLSLALLSPGWLYLACAAVGGGLLVWRASMLALAPDRAHARATFHASLIQLSLLLLGTIADGWMRAALGA